MSSRWDDGAESAKRFARAHSPVSNAHQLMSGDVKGFVTSLAIVEATWIGTYFVGSAVLDAVTPDFGPGYDTGAEMGYWAFRRVVMPATFSVARNVVPPVAIVAAIVGVSYVGSKVITQQYGKQIEDLPENEQRSMWRGYSAALSGGFSTGSYEY